MKALRVDESGVQVSNVEIPHLEGESLVRVTLSGICNTDLEIVRGYAGFKGTIGHEFVGVVDEGPRRGKRVVGEINAGCGTCNDCLRGDSRHCPGRTVLGIVGRDGAHAEYVSLPDTNLLELPDSVSDEAAVFVEPLAAALGITERVSVTRDLRVAVIGDGKLGLLCAMSLAIHSDGVHLIGKHPEKMAIAESAGVKAVSFGAGAQLDRTFDIVVEASGQESGFTTALDILKPRGTIVLKSTFHGTTSWEASRVVVDEISVVGSRCGRFAPAIELLASGRIDPSPMITETFSLAQGVKALQRAGEKGVLKVLLKP